MAEVPEALRDALAAGVRVPTTIEGIARYFGDARGAQNRGIADFLGVTMRTVQRWRTTGAERRTPRAAMLDRLRDEATDRAIVKKLRRRRGKGTTVDFVGRILISRDERRRHVTGIELDERDFDAVIDAVEKRDWRHAGQVFEYGFLDAWGINPDVAEITEISVLRLYD